MFRCAFHTGEMARVFYVRLQTLIHIIQRLWKDTPSALLFKTWTTSKHPKRNGNALLIYSSLFMPRPNNQNYDTQRAYDSEFAIHFIFSVPTDPEKYEDERDAQVSEMYMKVFQIMVSCALRLFFFRNDSVFLPSRSFCFDTQNPREKASFPRRRPRRSTPSSSPTSSESFFLFFLPFSLHRLLCPLLLSLSLPLVFSLPLLTLLFNRRKWALTPPEPGLQRASWAPTHERSSWRPEKDQTPALNIESNRTDPEKV